MNNDCIISVLNGKLQGIKTTSVYSKKEYYQFLGIPYAEPPIKQRRFLPPTPAKKWPRILDATKQKDECIQYSVYERVVKGSEDCLYLNVYTPEAPRLIKDPKAVIVSIHPGGHFWGGGSKQTFGNPDYFIHRDVIFVSFNFRLHALGFLNLDLPQCSGNMGLKDQCMALQWVKNNIAFFGGDPNNITLHGCSSAASDVHFHLMSPMSEGLFHKGIMQGGYALNAHWSYNQNHVQKALEFAKLLGFNGEENTKELLKFYKRLDGWQIVQGLILYRNHTLKENPARGELCFFSPTIEANEEGAFLSKSPRNLLSITKSIPLICGVTAEEGLPAFGSKPMKAIQRQFNRVIRENLWQYDIDDDTLRTICQEIESFYFKNKPVDETMTHEITDMYMDMWYCEWQAWLDWMSKNSTEAPVYVYLFEYLGRLNYQHKEFSKYLPENSPPINRVSIERTYFAELLNILYIEGASHADDGSYFLLNRFHEDASKKYTLKDEDRKIVDFIALLFTNFAKNGDPNDEALRELHWMPHNEENPSHLRITADSEIVQKRIFEQREAFWRRLMKYIKDRENKN